MFYKTGKDNQNYLLKIGCLLAFIQTSVLIIYILKSCCYICKFYQRSKNKEFTLDDQMLKQYDVQTEISNFQKYEMLRVGNLYGNEFVISPQKLEISQEIIQKSVDY